MNLQEVSDGELIAELNRRWLTPACRCRRWRTYIGPYDHDGSTWRCRGCFRTIAKCYCA